MKLSSGHRSTIAQFLVVGAACGAGYHFLVEPAKTALADARTKVSTLLTQSGNDPASSSISPEQIETIRAETFSRASVIQRRSAPARNEALMFSGVSALAEKRHIRVDQVQPSNKGTRTGPATPAPPPPPPPSTGPAGAPAAPPPVNDVAVGYSIVAQGTYQNIAAFVADLSHNLGFTVVTSVRLTLVGDDTPDQLRADIVTEQFAFDTTGVSTGPSAAVPALPAAPATTPPIATGAKVETKR